MSRAFSRGAFGGTVRRNAAALRADQWLGLAAAPTFALMALLTGLRDGGQMAMICGTAQDSSALSGMVPMYLLMSGFHSPLWLKLIADRRSRANRKLKS